MQRRNHQECRAYITVRPRLRDIRDNGTDPSAFRACTFAASSTARDETLAPHGRFVAA